MAVARSAPGDLAEPSIRETSRAARRRSLPTDSRDVGAPAAGRLHRASKAASRVAVYTHKDPARLIRQWSSERIHRASELELYSFAPAVIAGIVARLKRRMILALSATGGHLYVAIEDDALEGAVERHVLPAAR